MPAEHYRSYSFWLAKGELIWTPLPVHEGGEALEASVKTLMARKKRKSSKKNASPKGHAGAKSARKKRSRAKKMQASTATTRSTAGPGYKFEDLTAALMLLKMLRGESIPGINCFGHKLQMQTNALGWEIDDLLITGHRDDCGEGPRLSVSCKSNLQVSSAGLPVSFVSAAWTQWWKIGQMRHDVDGIALVTRDRHPGFSASWSDIKTWSADSDVPSALAKINASAKHRRIFDSVRNPSATAGASAGDEETVALIRALDVLPLEFQLVPSPTEQEAIAACRGIVASGKPGDAKSLWKALVERAESARLAGGSITLELLWAELRVKFRLRDHPDFAASVRALTSLSADYLSLIETGLPNGNQFTRRKLSAGLAAAIDNSPITFVYGNSGTGKSSLVKDVLASNFPDYWQVWLGPEQAAIALSEIRRTSIDLDQPLSKILVNVSNQKNVLVIDSAERLLPEDRLRVKALLGGLVATAPSDAWRIVIIGQTEAWSDGRLRELFGSSQATKDVEVEELTSESVIAALRTTQSLRWLVSHDDAVAALTNMRALAWVMLAESAFAAAPPGAMSLSAVADRLWSFWTNDKSAIKNLLMRLAEREASFERSFALGELDMADATALDALPQNCPLRVTASNRVEFAHDLAAEWARFQELKAIADDTARWTSLASSPLWAGTLRMLGQYLLRQKRGDKTAWDLAFAAVEQSASAPLAADILLDALCLDPMAEQLLSERIDLLLDDRGNRFNRLLKRFYHIATVPNIPEHLIGDASLNLHLEAQFRKPILGRWLRMAPFLIAHKDRIADLMSLDVAKLCETWLTTTPVTLVDDVPMLFRKGMAELALATARQVQIANITRRYFGTDSEKSIYGAALAGAPDLPELVSAFALEVARRRPLDASVSAAVAAIRAREARDHAEKKRTDAEYRKRVEGRRAGPTFMSSKRELPPWPLGPRKPVDRGFRALCLKSAGLVPLMRVNPETAAEVILAAIIDGKPEEEYGRSSRLDLDLGLEFDHDSYPTIYWKGPFLHFLTISPTHAINTLLRLVDFCTERWRHELQVPEGRGIIELPMANGSFRAYSGNNVVLNWPQANSTHTGQLFCALSALERWLCLEIDRGADVSSALSDLLQRTNSVAVLGVLLNVGKYRPELFRHTLRPLLASAHLYLWDDHRVKNLKIHFDGYSWARQGDSIFNLARDWTLSPYRHVPLREAARSLIAQDDALAAYVLQCMRSWPAVSGRKEGLELRVLKVELDRSHYGTGASQGGDPDISYPEELQQEVAAYQREVSPQLQNLLWPDNCEKIIQTQGVLTEDGARSLVSAFDLLADENDSDVQLVGRSAIAAALVIKGGAWLTANPAIKQQMVAFIDELVIGIGESPEALRVSGSDHGRGELKFAAYAVVYRWLTECDGVKDREHQVLRILTCWNDAAVTTLMDVAHHNRLVLGHKWWRLLEIGLLWSALSLLLPRRYDPKPEVTVVWGRWLGWLRARSLDVAGRGVGHINPVGIAEREEAIELLRSKREARDKGTRTGGARQRLGLETHLLKRVFSWLLRGKVSEPEEQQVLLSLWDFELWRHTDQGEDDRESVPDELGYELARKLADLTLSSPVEECERFWRPVLALGPKAHYLVDHFISCLFIGLSEKTDAIDFGLRWQAMLAFVLSQEEWTKGRGYYHAHGVFRHLLGFGFETQLARISGHRRMVTDACPLYALWAERYLCRDEDNLGGLCHFLQADVGAPLRIDGLSWAAQAVLGEETRTARWYRDETGNSLVEFLDILVTRDAAAISANPSFRDTVVQLAARLAAKQTPAALALQERISRLR